MQACVLPRRSVLLLPPILLLPILLLPVLVTGCATEEPAPEGSQNYPPLDFSYLEPLRLNVAAIEIENRFVPSGLPPDVSQYDPVSPVAALRLMADQRLKALGTSGRAVFIINNASLSRQGDVITGTLAVQLDVYNPAGARAGFANATVQRQLAGGTGDLRAVLDQFTRQMMSQMNVEFEYQVRRALKEWLLPGGMVQSPVEQAPLPTELPPGSPGSPPPPTPFQPSAPPPPQVPGFVAPPSAAPSAPLPTPAPPAELPPLLPPPAPPPG